MLNLRDIEEKLLGRIFSAFISVLSTREIMCQLTNIWGFLSWKWIWIAIICKYLFSLFLFTLSLTPFARDYGLKIITVLEYCFWENFSKTWKIFAFLSTLLLFFFGRHKQTKLLICNMKFNYHSYLFFFLIYNMRLVLNLWPKSRKIYIAIIPFW